MSKKLIIGTIGGDIIGSVYEWDNIKTVDLGDAKVQDTRGCLSQNPIA